MILFKSIKKDSDKILMSSLTHYNLNIIKG